MNFISLNQRTWVKAELSAKHSSHNAFYSFRYLAGPLDGEWGGWGQWTQCSKTCGISGGSILRRTRLCNRPPPMNGGKPCEGNNTETARSCFAPCPGV